MAMYPNPWPHYYQNPYQNPFFLPNQSSTFVIPCNNTNVFNYTHVNNNSNSTSLSYHKFGSNPQIYFQDVFRMSPSLSPVINNNNTVRTGVAIVIVAMLLCCWCVCVFLCVCVHACASAIVRLIYIGFRSLSTCPKRW